MKLKIVVLSIIVGIVPESYAMQGWRASLSSMLPSAQKYSPYCYFAPGVVAAAMGAWLNRDTSAQALLGSLRWGIVPLLMGYYVKQQESQQAKPKVRQQEEVVEPARIDEKVRKLIINNYKDAAHAFMDKVDELAQTFDKQADLSQDYTRLEDLYKRMRKQNIKDQPDPRTYVLAAIFGRMIMQRNPELIKQYNIAVDNLGAIQQTVSLLVQKKATLSERDKILNRAGLAMLIPKSGYVEVWEYIVDDLVKEIALMFNRKTQKNKNGA